LIHRDYPEAIQRREALERYRDAVHQVQVAGPEGEQDVKDEHGKPVKSGMRIKYVGFQRYTRELLDEAGVIDKEVEDLVDEWERLDRIERKMARRVKAVN